MTNPKVVNAPMGGGIDTVVDPAETRWWLANSVKRLPPMWFRTAKKDPSLDPWRG